MTRALDFTRQLALAACAVTGLPARLDTARLADVSLQRLYVLVVETATFWAVSATPPSAREPSSATVAAITAITAITAVATVTAVATITTVAAVAAVTTITTISTVAA